MSKQKSESKRKRRERGKGEVKGGRETTEVGNTVRERIEKGKDIFEEGKKGSMGKMQIKR